MSDWLEVGTVVAPQGLKGELRVNSNSDFPERFEEPGKRWLQSPDGSKIEEVELLSGRYIPGKNLYVIQLAGVTHIDEAEALRNYKLLVLKSDRPTLAEDEYHVSDLIDLEVYNSLSGEKIGTVSNIFTAGNDLLEVKLDKQNENIEQDNFQPEPQHKDSRRKGKIKPKKTKIKTILIPFVKEIVPVVDIKKGRIEITPPSGLLEINES
jgi:16S rRNA processing protein RimM